MVDINKQWIIVLVLAALVIITTTTVASAFGTIDKSKFDYGPENDIKEISNADIENTLRHIEMNSNRVSAQDLCENAHGEWKSGTCKFDEEDDDDKVAFEHNLEDKGLWDSYSEKQQDKRIEKTCDKVDGKMTKDGFCDTDGSGDTPKADRFSDELMELEQKEKEKENDASEEEEEIVEYEKGKGNDLEWENNDYKDEEGDMD